MVEACNGDLEEAWEVYQELYCDAHFKKANRRAAVADYEDRKLRAEKALYWRHMDLQDQCMAADFEEQDRAAAEEATRVAAEEEAARIATEEAARAAEEAAAEVARVAAVEAARIAAAEAAEKAVEEEATRLAVEEVVAAVPGLSEEVVKIAEVVVSDLLEPPGAGSTRGRVESTRPEADSARGRVESTRPEADSTRGQPNSASSETVDVTLAPTEGNVDADVEVIEGEDTEGRTDHSPQLLPKTDEKTDLSLPQPGDNVPVDEVKKDEVNDDVLNVEIKSDLSPPSKPTMSSSSPPKKQWSLWRLMITLPMMILVMMMMMLRRTCSSTQPPRSTCRRFKSLATYCLVHLFVTSALRLNKYTLCPYFTGSVKTWYKSWNVTQPPDLGYLDLKLHEAGTRMQEEIEWRTDHSPQLNWRAAKMPGAVEHPGL